MRYFVGRTFPWLLGLVLLGMPASAKAQLTITLTHLPASTPDTATVFVAGSFNNWNPAAPGFQLQPGGEGTYSLTLADSIRGAVAFKFTLGGWDVVETDSSGQDVPNRTFTVPATGAVTYTGTVSGWNDGTPPPSTVSTSVSVLSEAFEIPQLNRTRRIWIYLPPDYATSDRTYPVLYMHDGQNVFDTATSYAGEWGVDETLDSLHTQGDPGLIVVAIDNGGSHRIDEYAPYTNAQYGGGEGEEYIEFIVHTLKPHIDAHYRTRPGRGETGIMGSSMGGLISLYAVLAYPEVFGKAGIFSPSLWFSPEVFAEAEAARAIPLHSRLYIVSGGQEGQNVLAQQAQATAQERLVEALLSAGFQRETEVKAYIDPEGRHNEPFWQRVFPDAYQWLFPPQP